MEELVHRKTPIQTLYLATEKFKTPSHPDRLFSSAFCLGRSLVRFGQSFYGAPTSACLQIEDTPGSERGFDEDDDAGPGSQRFQGEGAVGAVGVGMCLERFAPVYNIFSPCNERTEHVVRCCLLATGDSVVFREDVVGLQDGFASCPRPHRRASPATGGSQPRRQMETPRRTWRETEIQQNLERLK